MKDWGVEKWMLACFILNSPRLQLTQAQGCFRISVTGIPNSNFVAGRIDICDGSGWRAVCDAGWDMNDAMVVCRQLGFPTEGTQFCTDSCYGENPERNGATNFRCTGSERSLLNCSYDRSTTLSVANSNDELVRPCEQYAGVLCYTPTHCPEASCDPAKCKVSDNTTRSYCGTKSTKTDSNLASGGAATSVLAVVSALLLVTLVGVFMGWVWSCRKSKERHATLYMTFNPSYVPTKHAVGHTSAHGFSHTPPQGCAKDELEYEETEKQKKSKLGEDTYEVPAWEGVRDTVQYHRL